MPRRDAIFDILDEWEETGNYEEAYQQIQREYRIYMPSRGGTRKGQVRKTARRAYMPKKRARKPSKYNLFVKKLSKQPKYKKMNNARRLKAIGVAWRKTPAGKKGRKK